MPIILDDPPDPFRILFGRIVKGHALDQTCDLGLALFVLFNQAVSVLNLPAELRKSIAIELLRNVRRQGPAARNIQSVQGDIVRSVLLPLASQRGSGRFGWRLGCFGGFGGLWSPGFGRPSLRLGGFRRLRISAGEGLVHLFLHQHILPLGLVAKVVRQTVHTFFALHVHPAVGVTPDGLDTYVRRAIDFVDQAGCGLYEEVFGDVAASSFHENPAVDAVIGEFVHLFCDFGQLLSPGFVDQALGHRGVLFLLVILGVGDVRLPVFDPIAAVAFDFRAGVGFG
mmetsp:Transcript_22016/g.39047  ORF Transcript_22016/g.39047 Transcript_22016/m.39047 type:complete len:283 (-) Transcript_22016:84-932(-)